ncbi:MAG: 4Fe-4S binding protein [Ardenticatenaceae bacterium]|nr:4Fe-4S binding protein [Ardenticatenaceae bacterium]MCB9446684.1 4Fe-4S binding protein [Ardenticatenaceae bacterium]
MNEEIYRRLAQHLDDLPAGYPATESGVELRILRRLFTPEEAALAIHLTLLPEEARVVARRAGLPLAEVAQRLAEMEQKGLIYAKHSRSGGAPQYQAAPFVVGIWEFQVGRLTPELVHDFEEYAPHLLQVWEKTPQLRTIPVGESIDAQMEIMPYEQAEEIIRDQKLIVVAPCICRQEKQLVGEGCGKPLETCLSFGSGAAYYQRNGLGREIDQTEALSILRQANAAGLVLQPGNSKRAGFICCCCGDCCGVLRNLKQHPQPSSVLASAFFAKVDAELCISCGVCETRCQMEALDVYDDGVPVVNEARCIGCGLCVTTCPSEAIVLKRKETPPPIPANTAMTHIQLGKARGKMSNSDLVMLAVKSKVDRLLAK